MYDRKVFFDKIRPFFNKNKAPLTHDMVTAIEFLLDKFESNPLWSDDRHVAYALATITRETGWTFRPIREYRAKAGSKGRKNQDRYWLSGYFGRGYVQLTWDYNYKKAGTKLGIDLLGNPDLALSKEIAFDIMTYGMFEGWFTGKKLTDYINDTATNYVAARRIINGTDKAELIANYAKMFEFALVSAKAADNGEPLPEEKTEISTTKIGGTATAVATAGGALALIQGLPYEWIIPIVIIILILIGLGWYYKRGK